MFDVLDYGLEKGMYPPPPFKLVDVNTGDATLFTEEDYPRGVTVGGTPYGVVNDVWTKKMTYHIAKFEASSSPAIQFELQEGDDELLEELEAQYSQSDTETIVDTTETVVEAMVHAQPSEPGKQPPSTPPREKSPAPPTGTPQAAEAKEKPKNWQILPGTLGAKSPPPLSLP